MSHSEISAPRNTAKIRNTAKMHCGTCGTSFYLDETDSPPFCSERCKLVDLNRWMHEEISLPHEGGPGELDDPSSSDIAH